MSDQEPVATDAEIREQFLWEFDGDREVRAAAAYDAWLAEHDRVTVVVALEEVAELIAPYSGAGLANGASRSDIVYWLRTRAAEMKPASQIGDSA